uniref:Uncharacterized protein n=1 Tax=Anopheles albimanus TaxID=7167 RepID=A0A182FE72_ANOAL
MAILPPFAKPKSTIRIAATNRNNPSRKRIRATSDRRM